MGAPLAHFTIVPACIWISYEIQYVTCLLYAVNVKLAVEKMSEENIDNSEEANDPLYESVDEFEQYIYISQANIIIPPP